MKCHQHHSQNAFLYIVDALKLLLFFPSFTLNSTLCTYVSFILMISFFQIVCFYIFSRPRNHRCPPPWVVMPAWPSLSSPWSLSTPSWWTAHRPWTGCCPSWPPRCGEYSHFMKQGWNFSAEKNPSKFKSIFILSCIKLMLISTCTCICII